MSQQPLYIEHLLSPMSQSPMDWKDGHLVDTNKDFQFPNFSGIPWLYRNPEFAITEWKSRIQAMCQFLQTAADDIADIMENRTEDLTPTAKRRMEQLLNAYDHNHKFIRRILKDFVVDENTPLSPFYTTLAERLPGTQQVNSYATNLLRDWSWDTEENDKHLEAVNKVLPELKDQNLTVFGAGAGRLAMDIHRTFSPSWTLAVDINPYLVLSTQEVLQGEELHLYDFPVAPMESGDTCPYHVCKTNKSQPENFYFMFSDCLNPPFKPNSLDNILTPWFIDIVPQEMNELMSRINHSLKMDGYWINFGPLGFSFKDPVRNLTIHELEEYMQKNGFELERYSIEEVPYLQTPHSGQKRFEKTYCFRAKKVKHAKLPPRYSFLPEWIVDPSKPIPARAEFKGIMLKNKVELDLLSSVDGKNSANDLVLLMKKHYQMTEEQARDGLNSFLIAMWESF